MKKTLLAFALAASFASAQSPSFVAIIDNQGTVNQQLRQYRVAPPMLYVLVIDTTGNDGYSATINYHTADGLQHTVTKNQSASNPPVPGAQPGSNCTLIAFPIDAVSIESAPVYPYKLTGAMVQAQ